MSDPAAPNAQRVLARAQELAGLSCLDGAIGRFYLTQEHAAANARVLEWMAQAGLTTWTDAAGSAHGRLGVDGASELVIASHLDSVPDAGAYDGVLGVLLGIELASWARSRDLPFNLHIIGFGEEEGVRFGTTLMTSRASAGTWRDEWLDLVDEAGIPLSQAMKTFGLDPSRTGEAALDRGRLLGYLEVHIEQGPVLEDAGLSLGVVTSIFGAKRLALDIRGQAAHAGTTPMRLRRDALAAAAEIVLAAERLASNSEGIATIGQIDCAPGAVNVVPGQVNLSIDVRGPSDTIRDALEAALLDAVDEIAARRGLSASTAELHAAAAAPCDERLIAAISKGIDRAGERVLELPSGAGHDAMAFSGVCPIGMMFVRSPGGISHHPAETVLETDVELAISALCETVAALEEEIRSGSQ